MLYLQIDGQLVDVLILDYILKKNCLERTIDISSCSIFTPDVLCPFTDTVFSLHF